MTKQARVGANVVFAALSNPERRRILDLLRSGARPAGDLVAALPELPQPGVSRHLRVLREAGLVTVSPRSQRRIYTIQPSSLREVDAWVSQYKGFWSERLDSLSNHLSRPGPSRPRQRRP